jgi:hypothetical protein
MNPTFIPYALKPLVLLSALTIVLAGCDKNQLGTIDSKDATPVVSAIRVSPDSVYIENLTPSNGTYTTQVVVRTNAMDPDGASDLRQVLAGVLGKDNSLVSESSLHDDGQAPDSVAGDGIYSGTATVSLTRAQAGTFQVRTKAIDQAGAGSNANYARLIMARRNSAPLIAAPNAPDSVALSPTDTLLILMTIAASDSDGLADIAEVYFRSLTSSDPTFKFQMYDDGGVRVPTRPLSGDATAGDGVFSIIIQLPPSTTRGDRQFAFQAADSFGDTSSTYIHRFRVY